MHFGGRAFLIHTLCDPEIRCRRPEQTGRVGSCDDVVSPIGGRDRIHSDAGPTQSQRVANRDLRQRATSAVTTHVGDSRKDRRCGVCRNDFGETKTLRAGPFLAITTQY